MIYLAVAALVYVLVAGDILLGDAPETFREVLGGVLGCAVIAALWPLVLLWRVSMGPAR